MVRRANGSCRGSAGIALLLWAASNLCSTPALAADDHGAGEVHGDVHGSEVNWFYGFFGESEDIAEPTWAKRTPGMPVPLAAQAFNSLLLFFFLYRFGKQPVLDGLRQRRESIMKGMDAAAKMKAEAEASLGEYEAKLAQLDRAIERVRREMREAAEAERASILEEAKKRRERMERDAKILIQQELKAAREALLHETIRTAMDSAERIVREKSTAGDHERLSEDYLASLGGSIERSGVSRRGTIGGAR